MCKESGVGKKKPFKKNVPSVESQSAFGGVGRVRNFFEESDVVSKYLRSVSHGIVKPKAVAGWYDYEEDLLIVVISGRAELLWRDGGGLSIQSGDFAYIPAKVEYRLDNPFPHEFEALFIRVVSS